MIRFHDCLRRREDGFSIPELALALAIFGVGLILLTGLLASNLRGILMGKQRVAANAVAQETIEVARSLTFDALGLIPSDPTLPQNGGTDSHIVNGQFEGEPIALAQGVTPSAHPFNPHVSDPFDGPDPIERGPTTLRRWIYITNTGTDDLKRVTVLVTWDRSAISPTAVENVVRISTLIGPTSAAGSGPSLTASADVQNGNSLMTFVTGTGSVTVIRHALPMSRVASSNVAPRRQAECTAQSTVVERDGGSEFGPTAVATFADDDVLTAALRTDGPETKNWAGTPLPEDIDDLVPESQIPGTMTCFSSVESNNDPVTAPSDILTEGMAHGPASPGGPEATVTYRVNVGSLISGLGTINMLTVRDTGATDSEARITEVPRGVYSAHARQRQATVELMNLQTSGLLNNIVAPNGLVRIDTYDAEVTATGRNTANPADGSASASNPQMRIWIYDPASTVPGCTTRSGGYCIIHRNLNVPLNVGANVNFGLGVLLPSLRLEVSMSGSPPNISATQGASGITWRSQVNPLVGVVRLCATTAGNCDTTSGRVFDIRNEISLGSLVAQVTTGYAS